MATYQFVDLEGLNTALADINKKYQLKKDLNILELSSTTTSGEISVIERTKIIDELNSIYIKRGNILYVLTKLETISGALAPFDKLLTFVTTDFQNARYQQIVINLYTQGWTYSEIQADITGKVDRYQGIANAGKPMVVGVDGRVAPASLSGMVNSVNGKTGNVTLTATDVNALPNTTVIPTAISQLTNDTGFITETAPVITGITAKIPEAATSSNQLADKAFVNSSISTQTSSYISNNGQPFTSVEQLHAYIGPVTNNDYAIVTGTDAQGNTYFDRYKATVPAGGTVTWALEYRLNNSTFTANQWTAINSGITSSLVGDIHTHDNKTTLDTITSEKVTAWDGKSTVSASTDGTNWTDLTINGVTHGFAGGGGTATAHYITYNETPFATIKEWLDNGDLVLYKEEATSELTHIYSVKGYDADTIFMQADSTNNADLSLLNSGTLDKPLCIQYTVCITKSGETTVYNKYSEPLWHTNVFIQGNTTAAGCPMRMSSFVHSTTSIIDRNIAVFHREDDGVCILEQLCAYLTDTYWSSTKKATIEFGGWTVDSNNNSIYHRSKLKANYDVTSGTFSNFQWEIAEDFIPKCSYVYNRFRDYTNCYDDTFQFNYTYTWGTERTVVIKSECPHLYKFSDGQYLYDTIDQFKKLETTIRRENDAGTGWNYIQETIYGYTKGTNCCIFFTNWYGIDFPIMAICNAGSCSFQKGTQVINFTCTKSGLYRLNGFAPDHLEDEPTLRPEPEKSYLMYQKIEQVDPQYLPGFADVINKKKEGSAIVYDGNSFRAQDGYGYTGSKILTWDGNTTGKTVIPLEGNIKLCRVQDTPLEHYNASDLIGKKVEFTVNGSKIESTISVVAFEMENVQIIICEQVDEYVGLHLLAPTEILGTTYPVGVYLYSDSGTSISIYVSKLYTADDQTYTFDPKYLPNTASTWGQITGTLSNQTDLQTALNAKQDKLPEMTDVGQAYINADERLIAQSGYGYDQVYSVDWNGSLEGLETITIGGSQKLAKMDYELAIDDPTALIGHKATWTAGETTTDLVIQHVVSAEDEGYPDVYSIVTTSNKAMIYAKTPATIGPITITPGIWFSYVETDGVVTGYISSADVDITTVPFRKSLIPGYKKWPDISSRGQAIIHNGNELTTQDGYAGKFPAAAISEVTWDGDTTGKYDPYAEVGGQFRFIRIAEDVDISSVTVGTTLKGKFYDSGSQSYLEDACLVEEISIEDGMTVIYGENQYTIVDFLYVPKRTVIAIDDVELVFEKGLYSAYEIIGDRITSFGSSIEIRLLETTQFDSAYIPDFIKKVTTLTGWNQEVIAGSVTPNITLPALDNTKHQEILYKFIAADTSASFTAPSTHILVDENGVGTLQAGNTLAKSGLTVGSVYECSFAPVSDSIIRLIMCETKM